MLNNNKNNIQQRVENNKPFTLNIYWTPNGVKRVAE